MAFLLKKLPEGGTLGEQLFALRLKLGINLQDAAAKTKIQGRFIKAIEKNDWTALPEPVYTRNYLKRYVKFLGADEDYFIKRYEDERGTCDLSVTMLRLPKQKVNRWQLIVPHKIAKTATLMVLGIALIGYLGLEIKTIFEPPQIVINSPEDKLLTKEARLTISGNVAKGANILINKSKILPDEKGNFTEQIDLERGLNIITIEASKRYSKTATIYRTVVFEGADTSINVNLNETKQIYAKNN